MTSQPAKGSVLTALRVMGGNVSAALVLFGVVLTFSLPIAKPHGVLFVVGAAVSVLSIPVAILVGRLRALPMGLNGPQARQRGVTAFRSAFILQLAAAEAPALLAMAFSFALDTAVPYYIAAVVAVVLWYLVAYPSEARVAKAERALDAQGATSELRLALTGG